MTVSHGERWKQKEDSEDLSLHESRPLPPASSVAAQRRPAVRRRGFALLCENCQKCTSPTFMRTLLWALFLSVAGIFLVDRVEWDIVKQLDLLSPTASSVARSPSSPAACYEYSVESIRRSGLYGSLSPSIFGKTAAEISMYRLGAQTLGVQIRFPSAFQLSDSQTRSLAGRHNLWSWHKKQTAGKIKSDIPQMNTAGDNRRAPDYDRYLGCDTDDPNQLTPSGTAVVVLQNFYCHNVWHDLANVHGIWLLLQVLGIAPSEVTTILPREYGTPFETNSSDNYPTDVLWPLVIDNPNGKDGGTQVKCFERIVFMETTGAGHAGPYWSLKNEREYDQCEPNTPYMTLHRQFYQEVQTATRRAMFGGNTTSTAAASDYDRTTNETIPVTTTITVCYMSRRLNEKRKRYFSEHFAPIFEQHLDAWANESDFQFLRLEFEASIPFAHQVQEVQKCQVLFGPHGAGLGHMVWMTSGGSIVEIGSPLECPNYYGSMSFWYGHNYTCFSRIEGSNVKWAAGEVYQNVNVTLLLKVLEGIIDERRAMMI